MQPRLILIRRQATRAIRSADKVILYGTPTVADMIELAHAINQLGNGLHNLTDYVEELKKEKS